MNRYLYIVHLRLAR